MRYALLCAALILTGCGKKESKGEAAPASPPAPSKFTAEIEPILESACGACHTPGATHVVFVGDEAAFVSLAEAIKERLTTTEPKLAMPPPKVRAALAAGERDAVLGYLNRL